jgi:flagellar basal body rod protein FlgG
MVLLHVVNVCSDILKEHTALTLRVSESGIMDVRIHSNFEYFKHNSFEIAVVQNFQSFRKFGKSRFRPRS